jgi:cell division ATPase FtsA
MSAEPEKKRKKHLDHRSLALKIHAGQFDSVKKEIGDRFTPSRASKIMQVLLDSGISQEDIDPRLSKLASQKRNGHSGGPIKPPGDGEEREYRVGSNGRIGVPVGIMGAKMGDKVTVKYGEKKIVISLP